MTTNFRNNTLDLNTIFAAYSSGTKASATGFLSGGTDLNQLFQPYVSGTKASATNMLVNGNDLCNIFSKYVSTPLAWYAFGTGVTGLVRGMAADGTGNFYVGGDNIFFVNGVRTTYSNGNGGLAKVTGYDTNMVVSTAFAQGCTDAPYWITCDSNNNVYAVGWFGSIGPNLNATTGQVSGTGAMIAKWNGTAWSALPNSTGGTNGYMERIVINKTNNNIFYVSGSMTQVYFNGTTTSVSKFAMWNGTSWSGLGFSSTNTISKFDVDTAGVIYVIDGSVIRVYSGSGWTNLTTRNSSNSIVISGTISDVFVDKNDDLWAVGSFNVARYSKTTGFWTAITSPGFTPIRVHGDDIYIYVASSSQVKRYDMSTSTWGSNLITSITGSISNVWYKNNKLYLGGTFTAINGLTTNRIVTYQ
jgi:hypothetical protein